MGKGGMRFGAGRPAFNVKAEQLQRVEIGMWKKRGLLRTGCAFQWSWNRGGEPSGSIGVRILGADSLRLEYHTTGDDGDRRDGSQTIGIARTSCHFGAGRPWFRCPICGDRAGVLYMRARRFACRQCQRVAYTSQSEDELGRMWRKESKLEARLGEHRGRPRGMRHGTYERLLDELEHCSHRRNLAFCEMAERLFGGLDRLEAFASRSSAG